MSFNAVEDKVIIKVSKVEETTTGGLFIPDTATSMPDQGTVVASGPGRYSENGTLIPNTVKVGDTVVYNPRAAQKLELEGEEYLVFLNEHILAIIEG
jgi:chaperonin GroES